MRRTKISEQKDRFGFAFVAFERIFSLVAFSSFEHLFYEIVDLACYPRCVSTLSTLPTHVSLYLNQMYT